MTIQQANDKIREIADRSDIGPAQKQVMIMRVRAQAHRDNPDADDDLL